MSVVMSLFLNRSRMPTPKDWAEAIRSNGFEMEMDSDFDAGSFTGFLPCKYGGQDAGFEYLRESVNRSELPDHASAQVGERDIVLSFVTHSDLRELASSLIASAVLCAISDGVLWDTESDEFIPASHALEWARSGEASVKAGLGKARRG
jgi:hypothetical protein